MHYYGAVYRPPSEAYSLIVQCTLGCSHNKCAFCNMYKDKKFSIRPVEEVLRDLAEARSYERRIERIFLAISVTAINGMAGLNGDWQAHAIDTAKAVSAMKPEFIAFLTLRVYSGTPLHDWIETGEFQMMGPVDLMRETRLFLEHIDSEGSVFRSNHASNYLPLGGTLNRDREALIQTIDAALDGKVRLRRAVELGL